MFGKISIIGCGLIGSSILRVTEEKKLATKISVHDKSKQVMDYLKKNFKTALDKIINEQNQVDENRLEQEIALLVIKQDIQEEIDRLKVHIVSMQDLVNSSNVVGKKLDFLSQELNREVNTICSKSQYSDLTKLGIEMKTLVHQFREQEQNVR